MEPESGLTRCRRTRAKTPQFLTDVNSRFRFVSAFRPIGADTGRERMSAIVRVRITKRASHETENICPDTRRSTGCDVRVKRIVRSVIAGGGAEGCCPAWVDHHLSHHARQSACAAAADGTNGAAPVSALE